MRCAHIQFSRFFQQILFFVARFSARLPFANNSERTNCRRKFSLGRRFVQFLSLFLICSDPAAAFVTLRKQTHRARVFLLGRGGKPFDRLLIVFFAAYTAIIQVSEVALSRSKSLLGSFFIKFRRFRGVLSDAVAVLIADSERAGTFRVVLGMRG
jgi:hypothetical protein